MVLIIILIGAIFTYKIGLVTWFLQLFLLPETAPETQPQAPPPAATDLYQDITRLELEELAAEKMKSLKIKNWYYISRVAPNDVLIDIIKEKV